MISEERLDGVRVCYRCRRGEREWYCSAHDLSGTPENRRPLPTDSNMLSAGIGATQAEALEACRVNVRAVV